MNEGKVLIFEHPLPLYLSRWKTPFTGIDAFLDLFESEEYFGKTIILNNQGLRIWLRLGFSPFASLGEYKIISSKKHFINIRKYLRLICNYKGHYSAIFFPINNNNFIINYMNMGFFSLEPNVIKNSAKEIGLNDVELNIVKKFLKDFCNADELSRGISFSHDADNICIFELNK